MAYKTDIIFDIKFTVKKILKTYEDGNRFLRINKISSTAYEDPLPREINASGNFYNISEGDVFEADAMFTLDNSGYQIRLLTIPKMVLPANVKELARMIEDHNPSITKSAAIKIVDTLGINIIEEVNEDPSCVEQVPRLKEKQKLELIDWCQNNQFVGDLLLYIDSIGLPAKIGTKIYEKFGRSSIHKIETNPYYLSNGGDISFAVADKIAFNNDKILWDDHRRLVAAVLSFMKYRIDSTGSTVVSRDDFLQDLNAYIIRNGSFGIDARGKEGRKHSDGFTSNEINLAINLLINKKQFVEVIQEGVSFIGLKTTSDEEKKLATATEKLLKNTTRYSVSKEKIEEVLTKQNLSLSSLQKSAVEMAFSNPLSILTGGPGTGKTYTINAIVKVFETCFPTKFISLLAPTGKAASRMREVTGKQAKTIHSALNISVFDRAVKKDFIMEGDFIIIDEASMISETLMLQVFEHIKKDATVLLVGDSNQLPSVSPGNVLYDFIHSGVIQTVELNEIFRQAAGSDIVINAHKIKNMDTSLIVNKGQTIFLQRKNEFEIEEEILNTIKDLCFNKRVLIEEILCLTPIHATTVGTDSLNRSIQEMLNPKRDNEPTLPIKEGLEFRIGDRVIHTVNNSTLGVKNGDLGTIVDIDLTRAKPRMVVKMDNYEDEVTYNNGSIKQLELAYALTVHKSQGSEADYVVMPFSNSSSHENMLDNQLIYTALTRAKKKFIGIGSLHLLKNGILKESLEKRKTNLLNLLKEN